jgi:CBS-domain-containing membrane protein
MPMTIGDVMTRNVIAIRELASVRDVVLLMREHHVSALPVVDGNRRVIGVVSESDLFLKRVGALHHGPRALLRRRLRQMERAKAVGVTAAGLMSAPAITIQAGRSLTEAATRMYQRGIKRLPVVDDAGLLVGIVTRDDLLKAYLRPDEDIREDIRRLVVPRVLERAVESADAKVHDGVVELDGWVTRRSQALALKARASAIDAVVAIHSRIAYDVDDTSDWTLHDPAT